MNDRNHPRSRPHPASRAGGRRSGAPRRSTTERSAASGPRPTARALAWQVLQRIEHEGAFANLVLGPALERSGLHEQDRRFATDLVYGTTRMRRACEFAVDRFLLKDPQPELRTLLSLGAYQLLFADVAPHAAVGETVELAPKAARGFVNAVLRKVAAVPVEYPNAATGLSYPDWIVSALCTDLGVDEALAALAHMNTAPEIHHRDDGYVQDPGSQMVAALVDAPTGDLVLDACAAPGGKATLIASNGATVVAADITPNRVGLLVAAAESTRQPIAIVGADATRPPFAEASFDSVLLDAPCSGLGVLRRRPDARWRISHGDVGDLAALQQAMIDALAPLVRPGGVLVYSVCTLLDAESVEHEFPPGWDPLDPPPMPWTRIGPGAARLLPQSADTDGMTIVRYRRPV